MELYNSEVPKVPKVPKVWVLGNFTDAISAEWGLFYNTLIFLLHVIFAVTLILQLFKMSFLSLHAGLKMLFQFKYISYVHTHVFPEGKCLEILPSYELHICV